MVKKGRMILLLQNRRAVEGVPLKLIVILLIIALTLPVLWGGLKGYSTQSANNEMQNGISNIFAAVKQVDYSDEGTALAVDVNFKESLFNTLEYVKFGDTIGEHGGSGQYVSEYKYSDNTPQYRVIDPNIMITSHNNTPLEIGQGKHSLVAEKYMIGQIGFTVLRDKGDSSEGEFRMADVVIYDHDIQIEPNDDGLLPYTGDFYGNVVSAIIHNPGNLDTNDPEALWSGDGKVRVRFQDLIIATGEMRDIGYSEPIDNIPAGGSITVTPPTSWLLVQPGDDPQDKDLQHRRVIVTVDVEDNIDEVSGYNNLASLEYKAPPATINSFEAEYDTELDGLPGISARLVTGLEEGVKNKVTANITHPGGLDSIVKVKFWWGDKSYPADLANPNLVDTTWDDGFWAIVDTNDIARSSYITAKAYDHNGLGSDAHSEMYYVEHIPDGMQSVGARGETEGTSSFNFDVEMKTFKIYVDLPSDLMDGISRAFGDDIPMIEGKGNEMESSYRLEFEVPLGADVNLIQKDITVFDTVILGTKINGTGSIKAKLHVGLDKSIDINLTILFDLIKDAKHLASYWDVLGEVLAIEIGTGNIDTIKMPQTVDELLSALEYAYARTEDYPELHDTLGRIHDNIAYYKNAFDELKDLWTTIMNFKEDPESIFNLVTFQAEVGFKTELNEEVSIYWETFPIFPPFVSAVVIINATYGFWFQTTAGIDMNLGGIEFGFIDVDSGGRIGLNLACGVAVGVDFGFAGGGIIGTIVGTPIFEVNAGFHYETDTGFRPGLNGSFRVDLSADLMAYVDFIGWRKTWPLYETGAYTLGEWEFDLLPYVLGALGDATSSQIGDDFSHEIDPDEIINEPGRIYLPSGPVLAVDEANGNQIIIECYDYNNSNGDNPDYEVRYSYDGGNTWMALTSNIYIEAEPDIIFDPNGDAVAVWTQCVQNLDLNESGVGQNDVLADSELYYAVWKRTTGTWTTPAPLTFNLSQADFHPSLSRGTGDNITVVWIRDYDNNVTTGEDQKHYYRTWNGTGWSAEALKIKVSESYNFNTEMVDLPDGRILSTWVHDSDENLYSTHDQQIRYSILDNGVWSTPADLTDDDSRKQFLSLAGNGERYMLAWLTYDEISMNYTIYTRNWNTTTDAWTQAEVFNVSNMVVMNPMIAINSDNIAILTWRSNHGFIDFDNPETGYIYYSTKDLNDGSPWTIPRAFASTNTFSFFHSSMALDENGDLIYVYTNMTPAGDDTTDPISVTFSLAPDLVVDDVIADGMVDLEAMEGSIISINASISNTGDIDAQNVNVSLYNGDPETGGQWLASREVPVLSRQGGVNVSFDWKVEEGVHELHVLADPDNIIFEHSVNNNADHCSITSLHDLSLETMTFSSNVEVGDDVEITVNLINKGLALAEKVVIDIYEGHPDHGGILVGSRELDKLGVGEAGSVLFQWTARAGEHDLYASVGASGDDLDPANDLLYDTISILPDLYIGMDDVGISSSILTEGENVTFTVNVLNKGLASAEKIGVKISTSEEFIGYVQIPSLPIGESLEVDIDWSPPEGSHITYIHVDAGNQIKEMEENNNYGTTILTVLPPVDLSISDLTIEEIEPGLARISASILNDRNGSVENVDVRFHDGNSELTGNLIKAETIRRINGSSFFEIEIEWAAIPGNKTVFVVVDAQDMIKESNETNNVRHMSIWITGSASEKQDSNMYLGLLLCLVAIPAVIIFFYKRRLEQ